jgi:hypothetical protein
VDFARGGYNEPRFDCLGAECFHGKGVGQPCTREEDCLTGACGTLPQSGATKVCIASDGSTCEDGSPYCRCHLGKDRFGGASFTGYCGGCNGEGRIAADDGSCFRDCSTESYCAAGQVCKDFSGGQQGYCD